MHLPGCAAEAGRYVHRDDRCLGSVDGLDRVQIGAFQRARQPRAQQRIDHEIGTGAQRLGELHDRTAASLELPPGARRVAIQAVRIRQRRHVDAEAGGHGQSRNDIAVAGVVPRAAQHQPAPRLREICSRPRSKTT